MVRAKNAPRLSRPNRSFLPRQGREYHVLRLVDLFLEYDSNAIDGPVHLVSCEIDLPLTDGSRQQHRRAPPAAGGRRVQWYDD
jgi:hypothetical protein